MIFGAVVPSAQRWRRPWLNTVYSRISMHTWQKTEEDSDCDLSKLAEWRRWTSSWIPPVRNPSAGTLPVNVGRRQAQNEYRTDARGLVKILVPTWSQDVSVVEPNVVIDQMNVSNPSRPHRKIYSCLRSGLHFAWVTTHSAHTYL